MAGIKSNFKKRKCGKNRWKKL